MLSEFMLANFTNLNHGSFGATPREVIDAQRRWIDRAEARPDDWFRRDYKDVLAGVRTRVAAMLDADDDDVTFVENASSAMNAVFRSYVTPIRLRLLLLVPPSSRPQVLVSTLSSMGNIVDETTGRLQDLPAPLFEQSSLCIVRSRTHHTTHALAGCSGNPRTASWCWIRRMGW
jgi:hypothetical protein